MNDDLKRLYIYILKNKWSIKTYYLNPSWWKGAHCYWIEIEGQMLDHDICLTKTGETIK